MVQVGRPQDEKDGSKKSSILIQVMLSQKNTGLKNSSPQWFALCKVSTRVLYFEKYKASKLVVPFGLGCDVCVLTKKCMSSTHGTTR